ncbi:zinc ribbon domain-containing protein [Comamonas testosteroni]
MSSTKSMLKSIDFGQLMRAAEGLTQWRVLGLSFLTWLAGGLVLMGGQMLATRMGSVFLAFLFFVAALIVFWAGTSAVGILLQDKAKDVEERSIADALRAGLLCVPKFILFGLLVLALVLALCLVGALVYFICKIPFIGPILLFFAHPAMVIIASVFFIALYWVAAPLLAPAIWDGRSLKGAVSLVVSVVRTRLVPLVLMLLALYVVVGIIALVLFSGFVPGFAYMTALASGIIGPTMLGGFGGGAFGPMAFNGHLVAGTLSTVILFAVLMALTMQVMIMGMNIIYLMVTDGLDEKATEESLQAGIALAREKARQAQDMAREAADKVRHATHTETHAPQAGAPSTGMPGTAGQNSMPSSAANPADIFAASPAATPAANSAAAGLGAAVATAAHVAAQAAHAPTAQGSQGPAVAPVAPAATEASAPAPQPAKAAVESVPPVQAPAPVAPVSPPAPVATPSGAAVPGATSTATPAQSATQAPLPRCSNCFEVVAADDMFCGHCGHKLH